MNETYLRHWMKLSRRQANSDGYRHKKPQLRLLSKWIRWGF